MGGFSSFDSVVRRAIIDTAPRAAHGHIGRHIAVVRMLKPISRPDMRAIDVASFGTILPALRDVLGIHDVTCTGIPQNGKPRQDQISINGKISCPFDRFDIEEEFPYQDASFDLVIFTEVLEHISRDPMHVMAEMNRITKPQGWIALSTPNAASTHAVLCAIRGDHPYNWSPFSKEGDRDRHNREYTPTEVRNLLISSGYEVKELFTRHDAYRTNPNMLRHAILASGLALASLCLNRFVSPRMRGQSIFALARKVSPVRDRFPSFLYY